MTKLNVCGSLRQLIKRTATFYKYKSFKDFFRGWKRYDMCLGVFRFVDQEIVRIGDCEDCPK